MRDWRGTGRAPFRPAIAVLVVLSAACEEPAGDVCAPDGDGDADHDADAPEDADEGDTGADADARDSGLIGPGPVTYVLSRTTVFVERLFDIDEDGALDNAVADLGVEESASFALFLNAIFDSSAPDSSQQIALLPYVSDRAALTEATTVLIIARAEDLDEAADRSDDFSGSEPFYASHHGLDSCGEPVRAFGAASLSAGNLEASDGSFAVSTVDERVPLVVSSARARGRLTTDGSTCEPYIGGALPVHGLGASPVRHVSEDHTILEVLLSGGRIFGAPGLPGLTPDLDLDRDGLETFEVDAEGHLLRCVDGDRTVVEGRDCWDDARFADAISLTLRIELTPAVFAGREPGWESMVDEECTDPPERSLFDPP